MKVVRQKVDSSSERQFVVAMIVSEEFLSQITSFWEASLFQSRDLARIGDWSIKYFHKYHKAPGTHIEAIFSRWVEKTDDQDAIENIQSLLESLSGEFDSGPSLNVPFLVDRMSEYITTKRIERLKAGLEDALLGRDNSTALNILSSWSSVKVDKHTGIDPLTEEEIWDRVYAESQNPIISFGIPDADAFFKQAFLPDSLIGILGPEKRGKTWWCIEFAIRALMCGQKVAFFEVGDMSESQLLRRFGCRWSERPIFSRDTGVIKMPKKITKTGEDVHISYRKKKISKACSKISSKRGVKRFCRANHIPSTEQYLSISVHANSSINVAGICSILEQWRTERNFIPRVIIIDYPDILLPEPGASKLVTRDQVNETWKALRRLSQEYHALVIAPTQANAASYHADVLTSSNFSEDKRKLAHVVGMLGLNQTTEEKMQGIMRLNWIELRESLFTSTQCLYVSQCLLVGKAFCQCCL